MLKAAEAANNLIGRVQANNSIKKRNVLNLVIGFPSTYNLSYLLKSIVNNTLFSQINVGIDREFLLDFNIKVKIFSWFFSF